MWKIININLISGIEDVRKSLTDLEKSIEQEKKERTKGIISQIGRKIYHFKMF